MEVHGTIFPIDVIAEYTRPARVIRQGEEITLPALTQRHMVDTGEHGEMEAFLTDGLRSVLKSIPAFEMSEFTVRWPGIFRNLSMKEILGI